jgi:ribokinase
MNILDVVGFGALNVDRLFRVNMLAKEEEESFIKDSIETCGGSAANAMVGLSRLGCKTGYIGKVACDREGELLIHDFEREKVDTKAIIRSERGKSGLVMGFVDKTGARALYINSGVNDLIRLAEIDVKYVSQSKFLHLSSFVGEESFKSQKELLEVLPENVKVSFDPGALFASKGYSGLEPIVRKTHVLMPNSSELALLTGENDYCRGADYMIGKGVRIVAVKLGGSGCYVTDGRERLLIEPFKVKVVDTTGAGDAFCAGFLYGLLKEKSLYECGRLGNFVASKCVMKMGARRGLPFINDLESLS